MVKKGLKIKTLIFTVVMVAMLSTVPTFAVVNGNHGSDNHPYTFDVSGNYYSVPSHYFVVSSYTTCSPYHYSRCQAVNTFNPSQVVADSGRIYGYDYVSSSCTKNGWNETLDWSSRGYWGHD